MALKWEKLEKSWFLSIFQQKKSNKYYCFMYFCQYYVKFVENNGQYIGRNYKIGTIERCPIGTKLSIPSFKGKKNQSGAHWYHNVCKHKKHPNVNTSLFSIEIMKSEIVLTFWNWSHGKWRARVRVRSRIYLL